MFISKKKYFVYDICRDSSYKPVKSSDIPFSRSRQHYLILLTIVQNIVKWSEEYYCSNK